jgi:hypothetical protein
MFARRNKRLVDAKHLLATLAFAARGNVRHDVDTLPPARLQNRLAVKEGLPFQASLSRFKGAQCYGHATRCEGQRHNEVP